MSGNSRSRKRKPDQTFKYVQQENQDVGEDKQKDGAKEKKKDGVTDKKEGTTDKKDEATDKKDKATDKKDEATDKKEGATDKKKEEATDKNGAATDKKDEVTDKKKDKALEADKKDVGNSEPAKKDKEVKEANDSDSLVVEPPSKKSAEKQNEEKATEKLVAAVKKDPFDFLSQADRKLMETDMLEFMKRFAPSYCVPVYKTWTIPKTPAK